MSHTFIVTHDSISSHQLRAYGDTIYEGYITFSVPEGQMVGSKWLQYDTPEIREQVKRYLKCHAVDFMEGPLGSADWHVPRLKTLRHEGGGKWYYYIWRHYDD